MRQLTALLYCLLLLNVPCRGWAQQTSFTAYCISNMDGTGDCRRDDNNESITCVAIPGSVIDCYDKDKHSYDCVFFGTPAAAYSQQPLLCTLNKVKKNSDLVIIDKFPIIQNKGVDSSEIVDDDIVSNVFRESLVSIPPPVPLTPASSNSFNSRDDVF